MSFFDAVDVYIRLMVRRIDAHRFFFLLDLAVTVGTKCRGEAGAIVMCMFDDASFV